MCKHKITEPILSYAIQTHCPWLTEKDKKGEGDTNISKQNLKN